jgi:hypothetical protein
MLKSDSIDPTVPTGNEPFVWGQGTLTGGYYRSDYDLDLVAVYADAIHPMSPRLPFISQNAVRAYRLPFNTMADLWSDDRVMWQDMNYPWISRMSQRMPPFLEGSYSNRDFYSEMTDVDSGDPTGYGVWSEDVPDKAFYGSYIANNLDSKIEMLEKPHHTEGFTGTGTTLIAYFKRDSTEADGGYLFGKAVNGSGEYFFELLLTTPSSNNILLRLMVISEDVPPVTAIFQVEWYVKVTNGFADDLWHQIAVVYNAKSAEIFIDGEPRKSGMLGSSISNWTPYYAKSQYSTVFMSLYPYGEGWGGNAGHTMKGFAAKFIWLDKSLGADEVRLFYNTYPRRLWWSPDSAEYKEARQELFYDLDKTKWTNNRERYSQINVRYHLDEGIDIYCHDSGVNQYDMLAYNYPTWYRGPSKRQNYCMYFDGVDQRASALNIGFLLLAGSGEYRTITIWVKTAQTGTTTDFLTIDGSGGIRFHPQRITVWYFTSLHYDFVKSISDNRWHQVKVVYYNDGTNINLTIYIDGLLDGTASETLVTLGGTPVGANISIGGTRLNTNYCACFISEVEIYNVGLSASEVKYIYEHSGRYPTIEAKYASIISSPQQYHMQVDPRDSLLKRDERDSIWVDNGFIAMEVRRTVGELGWCNVYAWDKDVSNWDLLGALAVYFDNNGRDVIHYVVDQFELIEVNPNLVIVEMTMGGENNIGDVLNGGGADRNNEALPKVRARLENGKMGVIFEFIDLGYYTDEYDVFGLGWALMQQAGAHHNLVDLDGKVNVPEIVGRDDDATISNTRIDALLAPFIAKGRGYTGFIGCNKQSSNGSAVQAAYIQGICRVIKFYDIDVNTKFVIGMSPVAAKLVYPRDKGETGISAVSTHTAGNFGSVSTTVKGVDGDAYVAGDAIGDYVQYNMTSISQGQWLAYVVGGKGNWGGFSWSATSTSRQFKLQALEDSTVLEEITDVIGGSGPLLADGFGVKFVAKDDSKSYKVRAYCNVLTSNSGVAVSLIGAVPISNGRNMPYDVLLQCLMYQNVKTMTQEDK